MRSDGRQLLSYSTEGLVALIHGLDDRVADLERRLGERRLDPAVEPREVSWSGVVADLVDVQSSPLVFGQPGVIYRIEYEWTDVGGGTGATVEWVYGSSTYTHTVAGAADAEAMNVPYDGGGLVATCTAADATAVGLTALVFLR